MKKNIEIKDLQQDVSKMTADVKGGDAASGMATGRRQHKPYSVTKELDKASPQIAR